LQLDTCQDQALRVARASEMSFARQPGDAGADGQRRIERDCCARRWPWRTGTTACAWPFSLAAPDGRSCSWRRESALRAVLKEFAGTIRTTLAKRSRT
jgi:hypothetical protein